MAKKKKKKKMSVSFKVLFCIFCFMNICTGALVMGGSIRSSPGKCLTENDEIELFGLSAFLKRDLEV